jgi:hypothetical protein
MMNRYIRYSTAALALAALSSPLLIELPCVSYARAAEAAAVASSSAAIVPAMQQIDAFGYSGQAPAPSSDTGSLVAASPLIHSVPRPEGTSDQTASSSDKTENAQVASGQMASLSWMPSIRALGLMSPDDLETKSLRSLYQLSRMTTLAQPHLDATLFGGGLASEDYFLTDEGIQLEQSITEGIGIVGRATGYQLWIEKNATSPLAPSNKVANRLNFGRFEGGLDLSPFQGFNFVILGGHDIGDSDAWVIEADISAWFLLQSQHPINVFVAPVHDFQNDVTSSEIDFRVVAMQTPDWILLLGAGGQVYGGGFIRGLAGEGGPIVGVYNRVWQLGGDLQFGYGSPGFYGELNLYKTLSIPGI